MSDRDRQVICRAVAQAKRRNPATNAAVFDFIRDVLLLESPPDLDEAGRRERELFVGRFQQVTSPVMAKGIEDTAFYRYFPLGVAERGGRRSGPRPHHASRSSTPEPGPAGAVAAVADLPPPPTTPNAAKTSGLGSTCFRRFRTCGGRP